MQADSAVRELQKVSEKLEQLKKEIGERGGATNRRRSRAIATLKSKIDKEARMTDRLRSLDDSKSQITRALLASRDPLLVLSFVAVLVWVALNYGFK